MLLDRSVVGFALTAAHRILKACLMNAHMASKLAPTSAFVTSATHNFKTTYSAKGLCAL